MLCQHRLPTERGRWNKTDACRRFCSFCQCAGITCVDECRCTGKLRHRCLGTEDHYLHWCLSTGGSWTTCSEKAESTLGTKPATVKALLKELNHSGKSRRIGKLWAACCRDILQTAELSWTASDFEPDETGDSMLDLIVAEPHSEPQWWEGTFGFKQNVDTGVSV